MENEVRLMKQRSARNIVHSVYIHVQAICFCLKPSKHG